MMVCRFYAAATTTRMVLMSWAALDAGLFFIAYVCDPRTHFIPMLSTMTSSDALSEYLRHTGSALFAVPPGVKDENDYICSGLFS